MIARTAGSAATVVALLVGGCSSGGGAAADADVDVGLPTADGEVDASGGSDGSGGSGVTAGDAADGSGDVLAASDGGDLGATDTAPVDGNSDDGTAVTERPGTFVAVGYGGRRARSVDDGLTWIDDVALAPNGTDDQMLLRAVGWGDQGFLAVGYRVMASPDGKTWQDRGATLNQWLGSVVRARGLFVAVGGFGLRVSSADGITWQRNGIDNIATHAGSGLVFTDQAGGRFVSANDGGRRSSSPDGVAWTYSTGADASTTALLAFGNGIGVGLGGTDVVISSDGGATWTAAPSLSAAAQSLVFARGRFTAVAVGHVLTSTDAQSWTDATVAGIGGGGLAYGHGAYVLVDNTGGLRRSTDTTTWTPVLARGNNGFSWVTFGPSAAPNQKPE